MQTENFNVSKLQTKNFNVLNLRTIVTLIDEVFRVINYARFLWKTSVWHFSLGFYLIGIEKRKISFISARGFADGRRLSQPVNLRRKFIINHKRSFETEYFWQSTYNKLRWKKMTGGKGGKEKKTQKTFYYSNGVSH